MFRLIIAPQAKNQLKKIPKRYQYPVRILLAEIKDDPSIGKPLGRGLTGKLSVRVGVFRIIYKVNKNDKVVNILTAGHRSIVYEKRR